MRFERWQAQGNVYLVAEEPLTDKAVRAEVGDTDGILEVTGRGEDWVDIVIWNPDGSRAELSGNGTRIAARWLAAQTGAQIVTVRVGPREVVAEMLGGELVEQDMGPVVVGEPEEVAGIRFTPVDVGNPHAVVEGDPAELPRIGPALETHPRFPNRTNVQVARRTGGGEIEARVHERGVGRRARRGRARSRSPRRSASARRRSASRAASCACASRTAARSSPARPIVRPDHAIDRAAWNDPSYDLDRERAASRDCGGRGSCCGEPLRSHSPAGSPSPPEAFARSCWATVPLGEVNSFAPNVYRSRPAATPAAILRRVLRRFGDDRFVHRVELGSPPPAARFSGYWRLGEPPPDALWAYISAPASRFRAHLSPAATAGSDQMLAAWEVDLLEGGLRDELCASHSRPLAGWSVSGAIAGASVGRAAFLQRFASPPEGAFRRRLAALSARYGFRVVELRFLHAFQPAPLLVVETDRDTDAFASDVATILGKLDLGHRYEGFFFEARDGEGAFLRTDRSLRGGNAGSQWAACRSHVPYGISEGLFSAGRTEC